MYKRISIYEKSPSLGARITDENFAFQSNGYHPLSYFVLGGIDVSGEALQEVGGVMSESDSEASFGVPVDPLCDPRTSPFDVAEIYGIESYENALKEVEAAKAAYEASNTTAE